MLFFDLEADSLDPSVIYCIEAMDLEGNTFSYGPNDIDKGVKKLDEADTLAAHNGIDFDCHVIDKLYGTNLTGKKVIDTLNLSRLVFPDIAQKDIMLRPPMPGKLVGSHSLEAWGHRLRCHKGSWSDWSKWSQDMQDYCKQDVVVLRKIYERCMKEEPSEESVNLEMDFQKIISRQNKHGFPFAIDKAQVLKATLSLQERDIKKELSKYVQHHDKSEVFVPKKDMPSKGYVAGKPIVKIKRYPFNYTSRQQIVTYLKEKHKWCPSEFTDKGNVELSAEILKELPWEEAKLFAKLFDIQKIAGRLYAGSSSWINSYKEGVVRGGMITNGAVTGRCTHSVIANIPRVKSYLGKEVRELFTARPGEVQVGCDAKGLELRTLAHYMAAFDDGEYADIVVNGDVHTENQQKAGLATRDAAKTFIYACVTMDTTVLTTQGWKNYYSLNVGDIVLTYNKDKDLKEWKPVLDKVYYDNAEVIEMRHSHGFAVKTTPNHRWFVRQRKCSSQKPGGRKVYSKMQGRYMLDTVMTTEEINSESNIIVNAPMADDLGYVPFLGNTFRCSKYDTDWTAKVLMMRTEERNAFIQGFLLADGYKNVKKNQWVWSQNTGNIQEALLVATYLSFPYNIYATTHNNKLNGREMMQVTIGSRQHVTGQKLVKTVLPNQPVWCIRTANESFVMRQGNTITITGNTLYGAGNEKMGSQLRPDGTNEQKKAAGKIARDTFMKGFPALAKLSAAVKNAVKDKGFLLGIDGRKLQCRSQHSALNTLLQSCGAIVMKRACIIFHQLMEKEGFMYHRDCVQLIHYHDEFQVSCKKEIAERVSELAKESITLAGEYYKLRCRLDGDSKIGNNWKECH